MNSKPRYTCALYPDGVPDAMANRLSELDASIVGQGLADFHKRSMKTIRIWGRLIEQDRQRRARAIIAYITGVSDTKGL